jgi:uncharacterized protein
MTPPIVTVRGEAQQEVPPDLASLTVTAHASGPDAARVREILAGASRRLSELTAAHSAAIDSVRTTRLSVVPVYDHRRATRVTGYRGSFTSVVAVHDFDALSALVLALGSLPDAELDGPWWSLRPDHPAYREVRLAAIADARRRAEDYAAAFDARLTGLVEISDLDVAAVGGRDFRAFAMARDDSVPAFDLQPAPQTVQGQVTARFTLSDVVLG